MIMGFIFDMMCGVKIGILWKLFLNYSASHSKKAFEVNDLHLSYDYNGTSLLLGQHKTRR